MSAWPVAASGVPLERNVLLGGRYRLRGSLGCGGTADVFRALDQVLGREVAVKVFRAGTGTVTADRFCDEARVLARLSHPALVTVYDAGRHGQGAYMVTELIRGTTLRTRLDAGPLPAVQVIRLGADLSSALDHVHAHGIIHHDVKPSNVLLSEKGSPHLADFGLSRTVHDQTHSASDTLVGTLAYMAPEQFLGQGASTASDIYALGITLLEALTGHREYEGSPVEIGTAHLLRPPRVPEDLPVELARLLTSMTDQNPRARPDAAAVHLRLRDLAHARSRPRGTASPTGTSPAPRPPLTDAGFRSGTGRVPEAPQGRTTSRRRAPLYGLAAASVAGACALMIGGIPAGTQTPATAHDRERPSMSKDTEAAGPRPAPPARPPAETSPPATSQQPVVTRSVRPTPARPDGPYSSQAGKDRPAEAPGSAKAKEASGKEKGRKGKGR
ncbi:serine/threonine-protein kinase [Streptomyces sp. NPDC053755]|uniref:serine/threonine-protein kinase n=1 Tax=Streptomyces sp. NPDC053755 TaxID=3155815 RepID=UPI003427A065